MLYRLAMSAPRADGLEIGFATGSTAAYLLAGLGTGNLTSIDYDQDAYDREGVKLIAAMGLTARHTLIESDSIVALPRLYAGGSRYGVVFIDGWKTFDHLWVDTFYCARMLECGGCLMFDDAAMPAVRKCASLLSRYYAFDQVDTYPLVGGWRQRTWHLLTTHSFRPPYLALRKSVEIDKTEAGRTFDYWRRF
ncbi:MAG TPA: class I SAM-dependent methyltransferase [Gemmatimonadaceae bacterium]|nr:class I SAM-dependent methyltransferase [Gemmatimonadaceae bacterium]